MSRNFVAFFLFAIYRFFDRIETSLITRIPYLISVLHLIRRVECVGKFLRLRTAEMKTITSLQIKWIQHQIHFFTTLDRCWMNILLYILWNV